MRDCGSRLPSRRSRSSSADCCSRRRKMRASGTNWSRVRASVAKWSRVVLFAATACVRGGGLTPAPSWTTLSKQVEIRRTANGVPHIKAENLAAAGFGEAYAQSEDYGARVALSLLRARGEIGKWFGRDSMGSDFEEQRGYRIAIERYRDVGKDTRDIYEGFAAGVNRYIELHPEEFPQGFKPQFTGYDVMAKDVAHHEWQGHSAPQSASRVDRGLLRGTRDGPRGSRLLRGSPHWRAVRRDRRIQSRPRLGNDEQRSQLVRHLRARRRHHAAESLLARW